jgi:diguanylate cyclase (GGDEF)-like protein/PAS domain S-box-containing protein
MSANSLPQHSSIFDETFSKAILNSVGAHIAVLDTAGIIVAVNRAWRRFARENGVPDVTGVDVGADYLAVCAAAAAAGDAVAARAAQGIEAVLCGELGSYDLEYPCHSPDEQRWFMMRATPLSAGAGVVIAHENITSRVLAEQTLRRSHAELEHLVARRTADLTTSNEALREQIVHCAQVELQLRQAATVFDNTSDGIVITDAQRHIVAVNPAFIRISGYAADEVVGKDPRVQQSGRHSTEFYAALWQSLTETGQWQGEIWNRRKDGSLYPVWENITAVKNERGEVINFISVFSDISALKDAEAQLAELAHHDPLTGLANRLLFAARLQQALAYAKRHDTRAALLFCDLDRFKIVNDTLGHAAGDRLLQQVAERLARCVRAEDTVARIGGDEFAVIVSDLDQPESAARLARHIGAELEGEFELDGLCLSASASIGIGIYPDDADNDGDLLKAADVAMYSAKEQGRRTYRFFRSELSDQAARDMAVENGLRQALGNQELLLHYQPQFVPHTGELFGIEALVRWSHPRHGLMPPGYFISVAEESGLIGSLGQWVLREACAQVEAWRRAGFVVPRLAINISGREILYDHLAQNVARILAETGLDPGNVAIELEITESVLHHGGRSQDTLHALRDLGVFIAIDDFGTGYSSLSQLKRLPVDAVKIDRSFLVDLQTDDDSKAIVSAIVAMGRALRLQVVAEGVETPAQLDFLRRLECDAVQGFLLSEPLTAEAMGRLLVEGPARRN